MFNVLTIAFAYHNFYAMEAYLRVECEVYVQCLAMCYVYKIMVINQACVYHVASMMYTMYTLRCITSTTPAILATKIATRPPVHNLTWKSAKAKKTERE